MSYTQTTTESRSSQSWEPKVFNRPSQAKPVKVPVVKNDVSIIATVNDLFHLLEKHEEMQDHTSLRLFKWGAKTINLVTLITEENGRYSDERLIARLEKLKRILRGPDGLIFKEPCLMEFEEDGKVKEIVWEKSRLERYCQRVSEFCEEQIHARPHEFAKDMVSLVELDSDFKAEPAPVTIKKFGVVIPLKYPNKLKEVEPGSEAAHQELLEFVEEISKIFFEREQRIAIKELKKMNQALELTLEQSEERLSETITRIDRTGKQHTLYLKKSLKKIEGEYRSGMNTAYGLIKDAKEELEETRGQLTRAQREINSQKATIGYLSTQMNYLNSQVAQLHHDVNNNDGGCVIC
jgi:hypothetical protein